MPEFPESRGSEFPELTCSNLNSLDRSPHPFDLLLNSIALRDQPFQISSNPATFSHGSNRVLLAVEESKIKNGFLSHHWKPAVFVFSFCRNARHYRVRNLQSSQDAERISVRPIRAARSAIRYCFRATSRMSTVRYLVKQHDEHFTFTRQAPGALDLG